MEKGLSRRSLYYAAAEILGEFPSIGQAEVEVEYIIRKKARSGINFHDDDPICNGTFSFLLSVGIV